MRIAASSLIISLCLLVQLGSAQKTPVFVTASFQDRNGLFVENLTSSEVQVSEDGQSRSIELFARDELPAVFGIIIQRAVISEQWAQQWRPGMAPGPALSSPRDLAYELVDKYLGRHATWVGAYDSDFRVALEPGADGFAVKDAIQRLQEVRRPESFLHSALFSAVQKMAERSERRRVLIVFLDFIDAKTAGKLQPVRNLLSASNVELFSVSFATRLSSGPDGMSAPVNQSALRDLARFTSGDAFFAADYRDHLDDISRRILEQIRTFYTIGYQSEANVDKGARLLVTCTRPGVKVKHHPQVPVLR
jgi:hypothetical protein